MDGDAVRAHPTPYSPAPEGHEWVAVPDQTWRLVDEHQTTAASPTGKRCRLMLTGHTYCRQPAVAELKRGTRRPRWWAYCPEHMYGRWIENGQVMHWVLREVPTDGR